MELNLARTFAFGEWVYATLEAKALSEWEGAS